MSLLKLWPKLKIYISIAAFILVNVFIFQNFESSFGVKKTKTDISQAVHQAEKDAQGTAYKLDLSSEAPKNFKTNIQSEPVKITLRKAPQAVKKKKKSYYSLKKSTKNSKKVVKSKSEKSNSKTARKISSLKNDKKIKSSSKSKTKKKSQLKSKSN